MGRFTQTFLIMIRIIIAPCNHHRKKEASKALLGMPMQLNAKGTNENGMLSIPTIDSAEGTQKQAHEEVKSSQQTQLLLCCYYERTK
jgi:hypothetical protein